MKKSKGPTDENGNPLILPINNWKKRVIFMDYLLYRKPRSHERVGCYGAVVLSGQDGKIVAAGKMRDLSINSTGFSVQEGDIRVNDVYYLEFLGHPKLLMSRIKVVLRRVQGAGHKKIVGVEFLELTQVFRNRLGSFINEMKNDRSGFTYTEII